ncbi:uncharacterized protein BJ212DRAFT_1480137 [Suillus subaureus]|uniref:Uncharacterized protein n=1 Tax=Suillus subaureus TaxID=48587 RepID=A0A9P7ECW2_9AGAM|nr:uncharacterized protein BJ212DRAFT_1480137 [Suillus subaureus]KAG1817565.1 hypothetical protein BJ212DRAFT_1480137 [Suillus subaureus]
MSSVKLKMLLEIWKDKLISWRLLDEDEYQQLQQEHNEKLKTGEIIEPSHQPCSDKGKKCIQPMDEPSTHTGTLMSSPSGAVPDNTIHTWSSSLSYEL